MNMIQKSILFGLVASLIGCQSSLESPIRSITSLNQCERRIINDPIVGGTEVLPGHTDETLVTLIKVIHDGFETVCTGSLISDKVVLTAGHCVWKSDVKDVDVHMLTGERCPAYHQRIQNLEVAKLVVHPEFDGTPKSFSDLALIYLEDKAPAEQRRLPLISEMDSLTEDNILLLGYGVSDENKRDSQVLRRIQKSWSNDFKVDENPRLIVIDQQKNKGGYCRGDSGSPLISEIWSKPHILGIQSANVGATTGQECHEVSVAMNARYFSKWIKAETDKLERRRWYSWFKDNFDRITR